MSPRTLAEPGPTSLDSSSARRGLASHPIVWASGSAVLLWCAFPPVGWWGAAWIALAPLFGLVRSRRSRAGVYLGAWVGGLVFWLLAIHWVRLTDETAWLAWIVMALALSAWWPGFVALARLAVLRLGLPLMVAAPILWVGLEYLRAHAFTGFPWYYLAHSQHQNLALIQIADCAGALGISFLIALANAWWVDLVTLPLLRPTPRGPRLTRPQSVRVTVLVVLVGATLGYGAIRIATARFRTGPRVALIQSNLIQRYKMFSDPAELVAVYERLVNRAASDPARPDLIVWPETSYPYGFVRLDPRLDQPALESQGRSIDPKSTAAVWLNKMEMVSRHLHGWADRVRIPMIVGAILYDFHREGPSRYNAALLLEPGVASVASYHKLHLVPFGEYVPLIEMFPWLTALTPYRGTHTPSLSFGREPTWLTLEPYLLATAICFEDTVPHVVRRFFRETNDGRQPDLLINLSNDGWFHASSEHEMHLAVSVFRTVENRVPLARAANTGISAVIDGNGRVLAALPKLQEGVLLESVPLDDRVSLYSSWGDWVGLTCLAVGIGLIPLALVRPAPRLLLGRSNPAHQPPRLA
jgi:apolipoprotein N-acyltransferase